ncbi:MAG: hypothetical protein K940chlam3_01611 [Chlamydiae bacterium]|nr:hypothetical protein [Chlamydiota bacterium]
MTHKMGMRPRIVFLKLGVEEVKKALRGMRS